MIIAIALLCVYILLSTFCCIAFVFETCSTVSSGLNSVSAVTWQDLMLKIPYFRNKKDKSQGTATKIIGLCLLLSTYWFVCIQIKHVVLLMGKMTDFLGLVYGLIAIGMAFLAGKFDGVLAASIVLNGSVAGPLLGVFLLGILLPFTNKYVRDDL